MYRWMDGAVGEKAVKGALVEYVWGYLGVEEEYRWRGVVGEKERGEGEAGSLGVNGEGE